MDRGWILTTPPPPWGPGAGLLFFTFTSAVLVLLPGPGSSLHASGAPFGRNKSHEGNKNSQEYQNPDFVHFIFSCNCRRGYPQVKPPLGIQPPELSPVTPPEAP